jgi:hypothetical protein
MGIGKISPDRLPAARSILRCAAAAFATAVAPDCVSLAAPDLASVSLLLPNFLLRSAIANKYLEVLVVLIAAALLLLIL